MPSACASVQACIICVLADRSGGRLKNGAGQGTQPFDRSIQPIPSIRATRWVSGKIEGPGGIPSIPMVGWKVSCQQQKAKGDSLTRADLEKCANGGAAIDSNERCLLVCV